MDIEYFKGTMLIMVINTDFEACLELLLEQGVSANCDVGRAPSKLPLFFHAVSHCSLKCIILLLDRGANYTGFEKVSYYYNP